MPNPEYFSVKSCLLLDLLSKSPAVPKSVPPVHETRSSALKLSPVFVFEPDNAFPFLGSPSILGFSSDLPELSELESESVSDLDSGMLAELSYLAFSVPCSSVKNGLDSALIVEQKIELLPDKNVEFNALLTLSAPLPPAPTHSPTALPTQPIPFDPELDSNLNLSSS